MALHQPRCLGPVDQADRTVVLEPEDAGDFADRGAAPVVVASDGEQQLVLGRREARRRSLLLTPREEPA